MVLKKYLLAITIVAYLLSWYIVPMHVCLALEGQIGVQSKQGQRVSENSGKVQVNPADMLVFPNVAGPADKAPLPVPKTTSWEKYKNGTTSRMAILLTDTNSAWLALAHGLKSVGVPFMITTDYKQALHHNVVLVYPTISGAMQTRGFLDALQDYTSNGGTLIGINVLSSALKNLFGAYNPVALNNSATIRFMATDSPLLDGFTDEREKTISLGQKKIGPPYFGVYGYKNIRNPPVAIFEDGSAAITQNNFGRGMAYAFGLDLGYLIQLGYNGDAEEMLSRSYINEFEPTVDVMLRLLKKMYVKGNHEGVTIGTVPFNKSLSVMITHDVDYGKSEENSLVYADFEKENQVPSTYYLQTKYIKDYYDVAFWDNEHIPMLKKLNLTGMELGSHSVAHSYSFNVFPLGTGEERYPEYRPFISELYLTHNGTVLGELRVSKYLIEKMLDAPPVVSFRSGHLLRPLVLPQALEATGFLYSSTFTANNVLSHLPFQLTYQYGLQGETNIFEFPLTLEDELGVKMGDRVQPAIELARKISKYGGIYVILIHPNILDHKLQFEKDFVAGVKDFAWFSTVRNFGKWWAIRDKVDVDVTQEGTLKVVTLSVPEIIEGLTIKVPTGWVLQPGEQAANYTQHADSIIINKATGAMRLVFTTK